MAAQTSTPNKSALRAGFTLIELSIVLVIIGLIIGGILVGQDLIAAAAVRAQISQIEKYNQATNTFYGKYGYLPGDINQAAATQFGFVSRGPHPGEGDGNGIIQGYTAGSVNGYTDVGEPVMFWVDLSKVGLVDGGFNTANSTSTPGIPSSITGANIAKYLPAAKLGTNNYIYVFSGGWAGDGKNYFGLANMLALSASYGWCSQPLLTVKQAYSIDQKMDDGLPQTGNVTAFFAAIQGAFWAASAPIGYTSNCMGYGINNPTGDYDSGTIDTNPANSYGPVLSNGDIGDGGTGGPPFAVPGTCYDGSNGLPEQYSMQNNAAQANCALSFRFQ